MVYHITIVVLINKTLKEFNTQNIITTPRLSSTLLNWFNLVFQIFLNLTNLTHDYNNIKGNKPSPTIQLPRWFY